MVGSCREALDELESPEERALPEERKVPGAFPALEKPKGQEPKGPKDLVKRISTISATFCERRYKMEDNELSHKAVCL